MMTRRRPVSALRRITFAMLICLLVVYVGSYLVLSRAGFDYAEAVDAQGFWFFPPQNSDSWRFWNYACVTLYYPLILIDNRIGTGKPAASEPTWNLS